MNKQYKLALTLIIPGLMFAGAASATHSWGNYHWARDSSSFTLPVVDSTSSDWNWELQETLSKWSQSNALDLAIVATENDSRTRKRCSMVTGHMRVCNAAYGYNGWLGLASINLDSSGHIIKGTAKMNDSYSSYWASQAEKNHVMCQEVGHVFGLGHTSEDGSSQGTCMDYSQSNNSQWPNSHDYQMLADIYQHVDSYNSYATGSEPPSTCKGRKCNAKAFGLGHRIYGNEHFEIWAEAEEDGTLTLHHVYLADGHEDH
ncbi:hypothetical protein [Shewanella sedimentimangrovi]|uniref:Peptidase M10 metallopeptidase domain-containing protein n=1 Tax=Shewanella sedimentimangrovi TaxID=2814293 RepID=A0ABX7R3S7_9GAMM|nr:hypothetical protein [Shewanella sedimentimangrovi]QSX37840.1 hypothetical protein JYB85_03075 [Shewanella sedimentimangrovi]